MLTKMAMSSSVSFESGASNSAGTMVAPELIQDDCTPENLAREAALRLDNADIAGRQVAAQYGALEKMGRGGPDPSDAAAEAILKIIA